MIMYVHSTSSKNTAAEQQCSIMDFYYGTGSRFFRGTFSGTLGFTTLRINATFYRHDDYLVQTTGSGVTAGGSKNNPYLQERWVEISVTVNPSNLVTRIVAVREQLAMIWSTRDLPQIMNINVDTALLDFLEDTTRNKKNNAKNSRN